MDGCRSGLPSQAPTLALRVPRRSLPDRFSEVFSVSRTSRIIVACLAALLVFASVASAAVKSGRYDGKVAAGFGSPQFTLTVKKGKVTDLVARVFYSCNNGPQQQTIVAPSKAYKISSSGSFSGKTTESIGGVASETVWVKGKFSRGKVTGTIRSQTVGGGETCETQERKFTAKRR